MENSGKFDSYEDYWKDYHKEKLPQPEEKEITYYKYDSEITYWLDYYEDRLEFALKEVNMQLHSAQERKKEQEFELKLWIGILLAMVLLLPISLAMPMTGMLVLMIIGGVFVTIEIFAFVFIMPICVYKIIKGVVSKVINDKNNAFGDWIVQRYHVPRLTGEILACQTHVGRYKEQLANIASWREMLENGSFDMEVSEIKNRMEKVNFEPNIELASKHNDKLKRMTQRGAIIASMLIFSMLILLIVKLYIAYYEFSLNFWQQLVN